MSELLLKVKTEAIPSLNNTKWAMYEVSGTTIASTGYTWHFTPPNDVHDEPEVWHGHWEKENEDKIKISRKDIASPYSEDTYEAIFAGDKVMVVNGIKGDTRTLLGISS